ncbi:MAG: SEL1-like repeat protein, partial [Hyphomicrobium sp.]
MRIIAPIVMAAAGFAVLSAAALPAHAESSSWFWGSEKKADEKTTTLPKPATEPKPSAPNVRKASPSLVPATGDDAAYTAFDQGQYLTALQLAQEAAARGEPQAHTLIARIYAEGLGVPKDDKAAVNWYTRASEKGDIPGTFALGLMLAEGRGVGKNREAAAQLFEKAALTGHAEANYNLGVLFLKGDGKPENPIRAFQHIRYAAEKGIPQAQYDLAAMYQAGSGVDPNAEEAARWLSRAAEKGFAAAEYDYAVLLLKGFGLTKDEPKIMALLTSAAVKGIAGAQNRLAYVHMDGVGTDKNIVEAAKWRIIAAKGGVEDKTLDEMIAKLSNADRAKAETAASEWADKIQVQGLE